MSGSTAGEGTPGDGTTLEGLPPPPRRRGLLVVGPEMSTTFPLPESGAVTIGRSRACEIRIDHPSISRHHATLHLSPDLIEVEDLHSANGTRARDEALQPRQRIAIRAGDVVDIGAIMAIVQERAAPLRRRRIWNHGLFDERVDEECARAKRARTGFALLRVSSSPGRAEQEVEDAICDSVRSIDVVGRFGPVDWEVLVIDADRTSIKTVTARIAGQLADARVGVAVYPEDGRDAIALADAAARRIRFDADAPEVRQPPALRASMGELDRLVRRVAEGQISVLILGETGVGKEVLAERIHELSARRDKPYVRINCASLSGTLLGSELFGHVKGAFTGADRAKPGLLETADGGTVLLDEVGELPEATQVALLRVLEQREILAVGAVKPRAIDVRFLAATNRELEDEIQRGAFRKDLYFRLAAITLRIPPLRERVDEISALAETFLAQAQQGQPEARRVTLSGDAQRLLARYAWPGNIRELRHTIERAVLLCTGNEILPEHLPLEKMREEDEPAPRRVAMADDGSRSARVDRRSGSLEDLNSEIERLERERILRALDECGGNQTRAAELLGISRSKLISRLDDYGVKRPRPRK